MTEDPAAPRVQPYLPFPSFAAWQETTAVRPVVERFQNEFVRLREESTDEGAALRARATAWAAIDTGAIEGLYDVDRGFTITVAANTALLQAIRSAKGESVQRAVEDALAAYDVVLDLATRREPLTEAAIRELHRVVCRSQETFHVYTDAGPQDQPLPKGRYKTQDNHPLNLASNEVHGYAPVTDTPAEMARLVAELRSDAFVAAPPVQQAAYAHYAFVAIHPFADGNGRVARAIASISLYREPGLPLVVFNDEKPDYLAALEAADAGRFQPFVSFIGDRLIDTVNLLKGPQGLDLPSVAEQAADLAKELNGRGGYTHSEVDGGAARLLDAFERHLQTAFAEAGLAPPISGQVIRTFMTVPQPPDGFRHPPVGGPVVLQLQSAAPGTASLSVAFFAYPARGLEGDVDYLLASPPDDRLEVFLREVLPRVTQTLDLRLADFAESVLRSAMERTATSARAALRQSGYL